MRSVLVALLVTLGLTSARADTTYDYIGQTYSRYDGGADPAQFGTHMTGTLTFNFDTTGVSGTFSVGSGVFTNIELTSGIYTVSNIAVASVGLSSGEITGWLIQYNATPGFQCGSNGMLLPCGMRTWNAGPTTDGDEIGQFCPMCPSPQQALANAGTWTKVSATAAAVPGPVLGAGLPGLMLAGLGLFGRWRRRRRPIAP